MTVRDRRPGPARRLRAPVSHAWRSGQPRSGAAAARPLSGHDLPARYRRRYVTAAHHRRPDRRNAVGPVRDAVGDVRDIGRRRGLAPVARRRPAARRSRSARLCQAAGIASDRRPAPADVASAVFQGRARGICGRRRDEAAIEPVVGRYLHLDHAGRHYRIYFETAGRGHSARLPAYRGVRHPPVSRPAQRRLGHRPFSGDRVRPAVSRQIVAARRLARRGIPADRRFLYRHHHGVYRRARAGAAGRDGLLDRRPGRAAPGVASRRVRSGR